QEQVECPHCHAMTDSASGFCDECGLELTSQAIKPVTAAQLMASGSLPLSTSGLANCPHCGHALRPNARHCPTCGKKLTPAAAASSKIEPVSTSPSALRTGLVIADRYGIEGVLGQGGMGRVWKAYDRHLNKYVVIKT